MEFLLKNNLFYVFPFLTILAHLEALLGVELLHNNCKPLILAFLKLITFLRTVNRWHIAVFFEFFYNKIII